MALQHDIVPRESAYLVKKNHVILTLKKCKSGSMGYDHWTEIGGRKRSADKKSTSGGGAGNPKDPSAGIMDMMKDLYEDGDDNMKKVIGEAMSKAFTGKKDKDGMPDIGDMGVGSDMPGVGGE